VKERNVNGTRASITHRTLQRGIPDNVMVNEELGTCKLGGTNMQHVERSNGMEAAGVVGVNFQSEGTVQNETSNRTENLQWDRWENELVRWEHDVGKRWDKLLLFWRQGPSERRFAERGFAELNLEHKEIVRLTELIATERDATVRRETAKRLAAERVADCVWKKAAERAAAEHVSVSQIAERLTVETTVFERTAERKCGGARTGSRRPRGWSRGR
jgi:hypothetical protein